MQSINSQNILKQAINTINKKSIQNTDSTGLWFEDIVLECAPYIKEWDIIECYHWNQWPDREKYFPDTTKQDIGIDIVAKRNRSNEYIAIQCKSRRLDENRRGGDIGKPESDSFVSTSSGKLWTERWIITNGDNDLSDKAKQTISMTGTPVKLIDIMVDLRQELTALDNTECSCNEIIHICKTCMQQEAITESIRILKEHEQTNSGGLPTGQARGKIILPCGTGKTRISLRIIEELTPINELSIVLCPSIALVAQIRREYLQHATKHIRVLAVCSDKTAGYNPKNEDKQINDDNPTIDNSNTSASVVIGNVTTNTTEISKWISQNINSNAINIIFGTYQSSHTISKALLDSNATISVLIADEAHRTAGLRRNRKYDEIIREFTICHDNTKFPCKYRIYQTATPRVYDFKTKPTNHNTDWIVRDMDDETVFGVELYRKSYKEAVDNGWLTDYKIIALGVNDLKAFEVANELARTTPQNGKHTLTTSQFLKGMALALVLGGATNTIDNSKLNIQSCIAFMNSVTKSKTMSRQLQTNTVKDWIQQYLDSNRNNQRATNYKLEHLDAKSNVTLRESAKTRLAQATKESPHGVINVGIFGEGTDAPSLSSIAFLEPRKSPIDVIQAVGRTMRTSPGKKTGYIICPILIPSNADPEQFLKTSGPDDGWQELGQILIALRAHDSRIEDNLSELLQIYLPGIQEEQEEETTIIGIVKPNTNKIQHHIHIGKPGEAQKTVENIMENTTTPSKVLIPLSKLENTFSSQSTSEQIYIDDKPISYPSFIITGKQNISGDIEIRHDSIERNNPQPNEIHGAINTQKTKKKINSMINKDTGIILPHSNINKPKHVRVNPDETNAKQMLMLTGLNNNMNAISVNLLTKSGLKHNHIERDLNILEKCITEASRHLRDDQLSNILDEYFQLNNLKIEDNKKQADGCTIASLLLMNAAMLHQRIANGNWLPDVSDLITIKNSPNIIRSIVRQWNKISDHDFHPIVKPAIEVIEIIEDTNKFAGLERTLRHITAEAERIAEVYADMGSDHAGPLFNKVMGNQASDGAYFTRPIAAQLIARLTLDICGDLNWTDTQTWADHKIIDLACGSGTLLAAMLTDMKRRAKEQGANENDIATLQKMAVEDTIKGFDINPISLQLAASQLTSGNQDIRYKKMGLHLMPYGPDRNNPSQVHTGTLELLSQKSIISRNNQLNFEDNIIESQNIWNINDDYKLEDPVNAAKNTKIVVMNPPFTNRKKMGEKFSEEIKKLLQRRTDIMEKYLTNSDREMEKFIDKNSVAPMFVALADKCIDNDGIIAMIHPTIALVTTSGRQEREILAKRYHIHTILTVHQPNNVNMSQDTGINESIIILQKHSGQKPPTRFINLDKLPINDDEIENLHHCINSCSIGLLDNGWGEISEWPADRIESGDWTAAIWRSPELAEAAYKIVNNTKMITITKTGAKPQATGRVLRGSYKSVQYNTPNSFPILKSKGSSGQTKIQSHPDEYWIAKNNQSNDYKIDKILSKSGYLLITAGQDNSTARLTATADDEKYIGNSWIPIMGLSPKEAKAISVFINSTIGRLQIMQRPGKKLSFPTYSVSEIANTKIPNIKNTHILQILSDCWQQTKDMVVPQYRNGECEVRQLWDEAVAEAMEWDIKQITHLRELLNKEPHVRGLGYNQYADE